MYLYRALSRRRTLLYPLIFQSPPFVRRRCIFHLMSVSWCSLVNSNVVFWVPEVKVGEVGAFQLSLAAPMRPSVSSLPFSSLAVYFSHRSLPIVVRHSDSITASQFLSQIIDVGRITTSEALEITANLRWQPGSCITFSGLLSSEVPVSVKVC